MSTFLLRMIPSVLALLLVSACKTTRVNDSRAADSSANDAFEAMEMQLATPMNDADVAAFVRDLRAMDLTSVQANRLRFAALHPQDAADTLRPILHELVRYGGDINQPMADAQLMNGRSVSDLGFEGRKESYVCGALYTLLDGLSSDGELVMLRRLLQHGANTPDDMEDIERWLRCHGLNGRGLSGGVSDSDNELSVHCASREQMDFEPSCPGGWEPFSNQFDDESGAYATGCKKTNSRFVGLISDVAKSEFQRQCAGEMTASSNSEGDFLSCVSKSQQRPIACPRGFQPAPAYSDENDPYRYTESEQQRQREEMEYVTGCMRMEARTNPLESQEPFASQIKELNRKSDEGKIQLLDALKKVEVVGGDLEQPCRSYKSLRRMLESHEVHQKDDVVGTPPALRREGTPGERDIVASQVLVIAFNELALVTKIFITGRCSVDVVQGALQDAIDRGQRFLNAKEVYVSDVGHRCGLEKVRVVDITNKEMVDSLIKEKMTHLKKLKPLTPEKALALYQ